MNYNVIKADFPLDKEGHPTRHAKMKAFLDKWSPKVFRIWKDLNKKKNEHVRKWHFSEMN